MKVEVSEQKIGLSDSKLMNEPGLNKISTKTKADGIE